MVLHHPIQVAAPSAPDALAALVQRQLGQGWIENDLVSIASPQRADDRRSSATVAMKVAFVMQDLGGGGAERVLLTLARWFSGQGHQTYIIVLRAHGEFAGAVPEGVTLVDLATRSARRSIGVFRRAVREHGIESVCSTLMHISIMVECARRREPGFRHFIRIANTYSRQLAGRRWPSRMVWKWAVGWAHRRATGTICVSSGVEADLRHNFSCGKQTTAIANPIYDEQMLASSLVAAGVERLDRGTGFNVVAAGRLVKQKGFEILIRAFAAGLGVVDAHLYILGEGPLREELQALARTEGVSERVSMPGFTDNPFAFFARASLFVLSSRFEGLPNVLIQALCLGTPVLSTRCESGPIEILENGRHGTLVPVDDVDAMAAGLAEANRRGNQRIDTTLFRSRYSAEARCRDYERAMMASSLEP
jgi:glycosyltransferase involved in cell wall biosynthesis